MTHVRFGRCTQQIYWLGTATMVIWREIDTVGCVYNPSTGEIGSCW